MKSTLRRSLVAAALVAGLAFVSGCTTSLDSGDDFAMEAPMAMDAGVAMEESRTQVAPQVIRNANASVEVDSVDDAVAEVKTATVEVGGTIDSENVTRGDDWTSASFTIRVPEDRLDDFLDGLVDLGDVRSIDVSAQDVTLEVVDLEARISTLEASIERLRALQQQTSSVADLVAVESELANRQSELESLSARRDYLANQVSSSTVYLSLTEREVGPSLTPDFLGGLRSGWDALLTLGAGLITAAGFIAPTAILVGLIVGIVVWLVRRRHRNTWEKS